LTRALFERLLRWSQERDAALWVVTTGWHEVDPETAEDEPTRLFMRDAATFFRELGVPFADPSSRVSAQVRAAAEEYVIPGDSHPTEAAAALIAREVWPALSAELAVYCGVGDRCGD